MSFMKPFLLIYNFYFLHAQASFEVTIDDTVIHSKLQTMAFPDFEEVADITSDVNAGGPVRQVSKTHSDGCTIM